MAIRSTKEKNSLRLKIGSERNHVSSTKVHKLLNLDWDVLIYPMNSPNPASSGYYLLRSF